VEGTDGIVVTTNEPIDEIPPIEVDGIEEGTSFDGIMTTLETDGIEIIVVTVDGTALQ